jgi:hypothetical protein
MLVQNLSCHRIIEGLSGHHLAPMGTGIANGQENRTIRRLRFSQRLVAPELPMYRLLGVLFEVKAGFVAQGI